MGIKSYCKVYSYSSPSLPQQWLLKASFVVYNIALGTLLVRLRVNFERHEGCEHSTSISAARGQQPAFEIGSILATPILRLYTIQMNQWKLWFISAFLSVRWCSHFEFKLGWDRVITWNPETKKHNDEIRDVELVHLDRQRSGSRQNADDCGSKL